MSSKSRSRVSTSVRDFDKSGSEAFLQKLTENASAKLKPEQLEVLRWFALTADRVGEEPANFLLVNRTGSGKTMTYKLIHTVIKGQVLVFVPLTAIAHEVYESLRRHIACVLLAGSRPDVEDDVDDLGASLADITINVLQAASIIIIIPEVLQLQQLQPIQSHLQTFARQSTNGLIVIDECHLCALWALFRPAFVAMLTWMRTCQARKLALSATITDTQFNVVRLCDFRSWRIYAPSSVFRDDISVTLVKRETMDNDVIFCGKLITDLPQSKALIIACGKLDDLARLKEYLRNRQDLAAKLNNVAITYTGVMSQSERSDALSTIGMGNIRIVLTNQAMSHGVNINAVNAVCLIGAFDSPAMIWQLMSRASRDGTGGRIYWCCRSCDLTKLLSTLKSSIDVLETALRKSARDIVALSVLPALYEQVVQVMTLRSLFGKRSQASPPCVQSVLLQRMLSASPSDTLTIKQCAHSPTCGIERRAAATPTRVLNDTGKAIVKMLIDEREDIASRQRHVLFGCSDALAPDSLLTAIAIDCQAGVVALRPERTQGFAAIQTIFDNTHQSILSLFRNNNNNNMSIDAANNDDEFTQYDDDDDDNSKTKKKKNDASVFGENTMHDFEKSKASIDQKRLVQLEALMHRCSACDRQLSVDDCRHCYRCALRFHQKCRQFTNEVCQSCARQRSKKKIDDNE